MTTYWFGRSKGVGGTGTDSTAKKRLLSEEDDTYSTNKRILNECFELLNIKSCSPTEVEINKSVHDDGSGRDMEESDDETSSLVTADPEVEDIGRGSECAHSSLFARSRAPKLSDNVSHSHWHIEEIGEEDGEEATKGTVERKDDIRSLDSISSELVAVPSSLLLRRMDYLLDQVMTTVVRSASKSSLFDQSGVGENEGLAEAMKIIIG